MPDDRIATSIATSVATSTASMRGEELALPHSSNGAEAAFAQSQLGVALLDADGRIVRANASLTTLLGIDVGSPIGHEAGVFMLRPLRVGDAENRKLPA